MKKNLTANELRIYKYCQENPNEVYQLKIHELAEKVYTTAPSISKLVKKMGFNSFQEFKVNVRDAFTLTKNSSSYDQFINQYLSEFQNSILKMAEQDVVKFATDLLSYKTIITHGYGTSNSVAKYIKNNLLVLGMNVFHEPSYTTCNVRSKFLSEKDCFLLVSNSGESEMIDEIISNAKKNNCKIAALTSKPNSTLAKNADTLLLHKNSIIEGTAFENISFSVQVATVDLVLFHLSKVMKVSLKFNSKEED